MSHRMTEIAITLTTTEVFDLEHILQIALSEMEDARGGHIRNGCPAASLDYELDCVRRILGKLDSAAAVIESE